MPAWKVLLIGFLATCCMALATAAVLVPMSTSGDDRWAWLGGLGGGLVVMTTLFVLFLRHTDKYMEGGPNYKRPR